MRIKGFLSFVIGFCFFHCFTLSAMGNSLSDIQSTLPLIETKIPLSYHSSLDAALENFLSPSAETISYSYFYKKYEPFLESVLKERGMPLQLKLLPSALSRMNVLFCRGSRCGVWALPVPVAVRGGLVVDNRHDERFDFMASTPVALDYLSELYKLYGNWWAAILAFSNSPSSLNAATLRNADKNLQLWDYYEMQLLQNVSVIRDFILYHYLHAKKTQFFTDENIAKGDSCIFVELKKPVALQLLVSNLGISKSDFQKQNPVFRSDLVIPLDGYLLCLPLKQAALFVEIENLLYLATEEQTAFLKHNKPQKEEKVLGTAEKVVEIYTVRSGDLLGRIAQHYGTTVYNLKLWNRLNTDVIYPGQKLVVSKPSSEKPVEQVLKSSVDTPSNKIVYVVKGGDVLGKIALRHKVTVGDIKRWNNLKNDMINKGQRLIIYRK